MEPMTEQQMRALEMRAEGLRHLSTVALTLAGVLGTVAGTLLKEMQPVKVALAAFLFLFTALTSMMAQEQIVVSMETGKDLRRQYMFGAMLSQGLFAAGWAILAYHASRLLG